eukprot:TRINITY_DN465_c0_g1_i1.p1 TRINITY_DN465_c0_g1~~TRINITY_DN465_c0_g1_i1.p1  ORF type:complete len:430 (+),score=158.61 TRINITY_DN465_c0_g1_i1:64-1290(+)
MAPSRNNKRAAVSAPAEEPPSKKLAATLKKNGVTQTNYKIIADAISHPMAGDLPENCRNMLVAGLPHSLCVASDLRQDVQKLAVAMIGEVVSTILENMQKALDDENAKVAAAEASKAELLEKLQAAQKTLQDSQATVAEREQELQNASDVVVKANAQLAKHEEEQKAGDVAFVAAQSDKEALETGMNGSFAKLKAGDFEEGQAQELYEALLPCMAKLTLDASLISAAKSVLLKSASARGAFDGTVLEELDRSFQAKIADISVTLGNEQPAKDARTKAVLESKSALDDVEAELKQCSSNLVAAKDAEKEAAAAVKSATAAVDDYQPQFKAATELRDEKKHELEAFTETTMGSFTQLKDRLSAKKLKEMKAAEAAEAAAKAAEETDTKAAAAQDATPMEAEQTAEVPAEA